MKDKVVAKVAATIRRYRMLQPGERVLVALSGGADSMCLLGALYSLRSELATELAALYVDHGLRPDSAADGEAVLAACRELGVPCEVTAVPVQMRRRETGESTQVAARALRYGALRKAAERLRAQRIAVGHTADDQAETVLMRLLRGTGPLGVSGIPPVRGVVIRPLIDIWRSETQAYCRRHRLPIISDPTNESDRYLRNRVRRHLLPRLEAEYNPQFRRALCRLAEIAREDEAVLDELAAEAYASDGVAGRSQRGYAAVAVQGVTDLPVALARRVLRLAHMQATGGMAPAFERLEAALHLCNPGVESGRRVELGGGIEAVRTGKYLEIRDTQKGTP